MKKYFPDYSFNTVIVIDEKIFKTKKLLIFDIDNTLFYPETTKIDPKTQVWFKKISKKYKTICISNSKTIKQREASIKKSLNCELFITGLRKPSKELFNKVKKKYKVKSKDIVTIGDFYFTDVLFAKKNNATAILLKPFAPSENIRVSIGRLIDNTIINFLTIFIKG